MSQATSGQAFPGARITAIIFDMNGVLIDSEGLHAETTRQVLAEEGVAFGDFDRGEFCGVTDRHMFTVLRERHRLLAPVPDLVSRRAALLASRLEEGLPIIPGVPEVLRELHGRGYRLALASSADRQFIDRVLRAVDAAPLFDAVVSGSEVARAKPAPDAFLEAARRLAVRPEECLVVEDSRNGLLASQAAGMPCAIVPCHQTRDQDFSGAIAVLDQLTGLLALLS